MSTEPIAAAILTGGRSRRMGTPKATLRLAPDGPTIIGLVIAAVRNVTDEIALVGAQSSDLEFVGLPWIPDLMPDSGPLAGIHAALTASPREHLLVVACDMPFLNDTLLRHMVTVPRDYDVLVPVVGQPHPLHAIYARACLPMIEASLREGRRRVDAWFDRANVQTIDEAAVRRFDPAARSVFNMNTPDDLEKARRLGGTLRYR